MPPSDGCSGFQWAEWLFPIHDCCAVHDAGGTDGQLLDCLMQNTPSWTWVIVAACVALMVLFRPIYRVIRRKGAEDTEEPAMPTTDEEYNALPSGALFIDPDNGQTYRKP